MLSGFVPAVRIDPVVVSEQRNNDIMAAIQASENGTSGRGLDPRFAPLGAPFAFATRD
jgi:hypothetical protein